MDHSTNQGYAESQFRDASNTTAIYGKSKSGIVYRFNRLITKGTQDKFLKAIKDNNYKINTKYWTKLETK